VCLGRNNFPDLTEIQFDSLTILATKNTESKRKKKPQINRKEDHAAVAMKECVKRLYKRNVTPKKMVQKSHAANRNDTSYKRVL
jgi:hypothetical protein